MGRSVTVLGYKHAAVYWLQSKQGSKRGELDPLSWLSVRLTLNKGLMCHRIVQG